MQNRRNCFLFAFYLHSICICLLFGTNMHHKAPHVLPISLVPQMVAPTLRTAFTLIELMVTMAIVSLLAMGIFTGVRSATCMGRRAACVKNMHQIGVGITAYCMDNGGEFPLTTHTESAEGSWVNTLQPYLGSIDQLLICPGDPHGEERRSNGVSSYVLNEFIAVAERDPFGRATGPSFTHLPSLEQPAKTITVFIGADNLSPSISSDHTHSRNWSSWSNVLDDIQPDRHCAGAANAEHTKGTANYLYADGHVATIEAAEFRRLIDSGVNPALPPDQP